MTDLEITKACAEAMGYAKSRDGVWDNGWYYNGHKIETVYDPLNNDAQAMALVKKFPATCIDALHNLIAWNVTPADEQNIQHDFNRAICLCVAQMALSALNSKD